MNHPRYNDAVEKAVQDFVVETWGDPTSEEYELVWSGLSASLLAERFRGKRQIWAFDQNGIIAELRRDVNSGVTCRAVEFQQDGTVSYLCPTYAQPDWYARRGELEPGMVFNTANGLVQLDRRVPGDGTKWYVAEWFDGWAYYDSTIEPGELQGEPQPDPINERSARP